jgi:hypothetical protein
MRAQGLRGRAARLRKRTTIPDPAASARADRTGRDFTADASRINTRWCGDITYIPTWEGWPHVATVIDIAFRRVVGHALADHLRTELVADALFNVLAARSPEPGEIFHSNRGCQYPSAAYTELADDCQVTLLAGRTGPIIAAIAAHDPEAARREMNVHMRDAARRLREASQARGPGLPWEDWVMGSVPRRPAADDRPREWLALPGGRIRPVVSVPGDDGVMELMAHAAWLARPNRPCGCGRPRLGSGRTCGSVECVARLRDDDASGQPGEPARD